MRDSASQEYATMVAAWMLWLRVQDSHQERLCRRWPWKKLKGRQPEQQETRIQAASVKREDSAAVSHAVEWKSGGSKPQEGNCTPIHMVGGTPTVQAKLGGVDDLCMVDSGSMVSFVTRDFYRKKLQPTCGRVKRREQMLTLCAANGLEIPYVTT